MISSYLEMYYGLMVAIWQGTRQDMETLLATLIITKIPPYQCVIQDQIQKHVRVKRIVCGQLTPFARRFSIRLGNASTVLLSQLRPEDAQTNGRTTSREGNPQKREAPPFP